MGVTPDFVCKINCTKLDIHFASNKTKMKFNKSRTDRLKLPMVSVDSATEDNQESTGFEILKFSSAKYSQGLDFTDGISVRVPAESNISLDEGSI